MRDPPLRRAGLGLELRPMNPQVPHRASLLLPTPQAGRAAPQQQKGELHPEPPPCSRRDAETHQQVKPLATQTRGCWKPLTLAPRRIHAGPSSSEIRGAHLGFQQLACLWGREWGLSSRARARARASLWRGREESREGWKPGVQQAKARKMRCLGSKAAA